MAGKTQKVRAEKIDDLALLRKDLLAEIGNLRSVFRDISARYQTNLEAEMVSCINMLAVSEEGEKAPALQDKKQLKSMLESVRQLRLKPEKGRLKDIRKIDDTVSNLYAALLEH